MSNRKNLSMNLSNLVSTKNCFNFFSSLFKVPFSKFLSSPVFLNIWQQHCLQSNVIAPPICHCTNAASCMEHFYHTSEAAKFGSGISINVLRQKNEKNWQIFFQYFQVKVLLTFLKLKRKIVQSSNWSWKTIGNKCSVSMKKKEQLSLCLSERKRAWRS